MRGGGREGGREVGQFLKSILSCMKSSAEFNNLEWSGSGFSKIRY